MRITWNLQARARALKRRQAKRLLSRPWQLAATPVMPSHSRAEARAPDTTEPQPRIHGLGMLGAI